MGLELLHLSYVKRWVVAPTLREQSVAEHTFRVLVIAVHLNEAVKIAATPIDLCNLTAKAMMHDAEERLTGDVPGPQKSAQAGYLRSTDEMSALEYLVKVADSIETGTFWVQWGNPRAWSGHPYNRAPARDIEKICHYAPKVPGLMEAAADVWREITGKAPWT